MIKPHAYTTRTSPRQASRWWLFIALVGAANAAFSECEQAIGRLESHEGTVSMEQAGQWQPLAVGACVPAGVRVQVTGGRAVFRLANETLLRASGTTMLRFAAPEQKNWIHLFDGVLHFITRTPHAFNVETDYVNAGVKGTEFILTSNRVEQSSTVTMLEGEVLASNERGEQSVRSGAAVIARSGQAPRLLTVPALRDAVQWTLYYPPLPLTGQPRFQPALERLQRNDAVGAIAQLEALPAANRDADYYALLAAINLHRGEVDVARAALDRALALQPDHPQALALSAVHAIAVGEIDRAATLLNAAQTHAPRDTTVLIAQSYLEQAQHQLPAALSHTRAAAAIDPTSAVIQARVAELALMNGDTKLAHSAARSALAQQPDYARAHAIDGFVLLQQFRFDSAATAFQRAIALDATDPLPRLGLGLIEIRHNHVAEGREQLALAVALDPGQSLLRSYLGKAYQEEGRERLAGDQYALAKTLDAADPTPWFYSALLAQVQNRPFDALDDLNQSMARNDNRAVYRSRLQLDADEATRTASQAEIYRELGFDALAQRTAARAVNTAPSEYGGHRQLAEAYADDPQYDAARASEVLQAELLQPLSATPLLPLLGETNLLATEGAGPSALGFREYNAMFVREKPWLSVSGLGGSNRTGADEIALSGIVDRFSYALSQYHYEAIGHRDNNDARYDVLSAYTKFQASENLSFLLQLSHRDEDTGDLVERLPSEQAAAFQQIVQRSDSVLLGAHLALSETIDILSAFNYQNTDLNQLARIPVLDTKFNQDAHVANAELQGQFRGIPGELILGVDAADIDFDNVTRNVGDPFFLQLLGLESRIAADETTRYRNSYGYWTTAPLQSLDLTLGLSYRELAADHFDRKFSGWDPKVAAVYRLTSKISVRGAYFESLARPFAIEQALEPTQLGGFNQFVDEKEAIASDQYALGFDIDAGAGHYMGGELRIRKSTVPSAQNLDELLDAKQRQAQLFWNWSTEPWAISLAYHYEKSEYTSSVFLDIPTLLTTQRIPLTVKWFSGGLSIGATATHFDQSGEFNSGESKSSDHFTLLDVAASYSLWHQRAEVELRCSNVFNESFSYQNTNLYDPSPRLTPYLPERTVQIGVKFAY